MWSNISRRLWIRGSRRILQVSAWLMAPRVTSSLNALYDTWQKNKIYHRLNGRTHSCHLTWGMPNSEGAVRFLSLYLLFILRLPSGIICIYDSFRKSWWMNYYVLNRYSFFIYLFSFKTSKYNPLISVKISFDLVNWSQ